MNVLHIEKWPSLIGHHILVKHKRIRQGSYTCYNFYHPLYFVPKGLSVMYHLVLNHDTLCTLKASIRNTLLSKVAGISSGRKKFSGRIQNPRNPEIQPNHNSRSIRHSIHPKNLSIVAILVVDSNHNL